MTFIPNFADQAALAIQNARLRDGASRLPLPPEMQMVLYRLARL